MNRYLLAVALLAALLSPSCATIIASGPDFVELTSEPPGARVYRDNVLLGTTPAKVEFTRKKSKYELIYVLDGYHSAHVTLQSKFNGAVLGNIFFGGLIGLIVDAGTRNTRRYPKAAPLVTLVPIGPALQGPPVPDELTPPPEPLPDDLHAQAPTVSVIR